jgi:hypothetical protein
MARLRQLDPQLRLSNLGDVIMPLRAEDHAKYIHGLRVAGLPELQVRHFRFWHLPAVTCSANRVRC